jgi:hypothetical protein
MLDQIRQQAESQVPPALADEYRAIVVAGLRTMYSAETDETMERAYEQLRANHYSPKFMAHALIKLLSVIYNESRSKMKVEAAFPALMALMAYALDYLEYTRGIQVTEGSVAQIIKAVTAGYFALFKIDPTRVKQTIQQGLSRQTPSPGQAAATPAARTGGA